MLVLASIILAGAIVYLVDSDRGALLIAIGCTLALVRWLADHWPARWLRGK